MAIDTEKLRALLAALNDKNHPDAAEVDWHRVAVVAVNALPELLDALATAEADRLTLARALERSGTRAATGAGAQAVGEPVTEEMLARCEREAQDALNVGDNSYPAHDVEALVAEVRRLRVEVTIAREAAKSARGLALESVQQPTAGELAAANLAAHAAGYARAERDVAEAAKKQATKKRERDWSGDEVAACALEDFADNIEQDAEEIRAALGDSADADVLRFLTADARRAAEALTAALAAAERRARATPGAGT